MVARPAGVAGLITSWHTPFLAQARAVAPALAAGCTVVLKPDEWAPLPAALLAEITTAAGLPDGVLNIVHGSLHHRAPGAQARDALIAHPGVARLSFAGDAAAGQQVMLDAAPRTARSCAAELAGNAPCLIFADADLDQATDSALFGAFALNGQRRTATSTILVERPVYDTLVSRLARAGGPHPRRRPRRTRRPQLGPLPHAGHYDKLTVLRAARRQGRRAAGSRRPTAGRPARGKLPRRDRARRRDAVDADLHRAAPRAGRARHAVRHRRRSALARQRCRAPTAAYIWTGDLQRARRLAPALESASTWVNSRNPQDWLTAPPDELNIGFFTMSRSVFITADGTPMPRFGAQRSDPS